MPKEMTKERAPASLGPSGTLRALKSAESLKTRFAQTVENQRHKAVVSCLFLMKQIISVVFLDEQPAHFSIRVGNPQVIVDPAEPDLFSILFFVEVETITAAYTFLCCWFCFFIWFRCCQEFTSY
jgi:hypothetical protein